MSLRWSGYLGPKPVKQYEKEARRVGACLVHPNRCARIVYKKRHGDVPSYLFVCHTCDNPWCIEDKHHFLGTLQDNVHDAMIKGRLKIAQNNPEMLARRSAALRRYFQNPKHIAKHKAAIQRAYDVNDYYKNRQRNAALRRYQDPAERERNRQLQKIAQGKPEVREKHRLSLLGKPKTEAHRAALRAAWVLRKSRMSKS